MVKIKEVHVTANYAWSPSENHPIYIAAGTAAQQLDATFSSNANLELYAIDITDPSLVASCAGKVEVANRFHKVVWGSSYSESPQANGVVVCGTDQGGIEIYDPIKILEGNAESLVLSTTNHTGPVRALDFNAFQKNLFASGASDSEIFIWDLKNPTNPMTPGKKTQPTSAISSVAWNRQVQHILASTNTLTSGPCCVVWDLRKNEPIIKVQDPSGRMQCSDAAWHPEVATQLVLASEDDHAPVVQLWDLRFATSPMKVLEKHRRGVVSMSWCPRDPDLLLTCGKDNQVYCWNPNSSPPDVVYELETHAQWCFDVEWCPRNPNIVSTGSFDGKISIHSMMGGGPVTEEINANEKQRNVVAEAFGTEAAFVQQPTAAVTKKKISVPLKKPPKWMRKPCGANFVFGGKLVSFANVVSNEIQQQQPQSIRRTVSISQVVTDTKLLERAMQLRSALTDNSLCSDYCQKKVEDAESEFEENFWNFLKVNFDPDCRKHYLQLLGYNASDLKAKFNNMLGTKPGASGLSSEVDSLTLGAKGEPNNAAMSNSSSMNGIDAFDEIASAAEASSQKSDFNKPMLIPVADNDLDSLISQALLIGDYSAAVDLCLHGNRMADAIVVAIAGGPALLEKTQKQYFAASESKIARLLSAVVTKSWKDIVKSCDLHNWKEALASLLTYASPEDLISYCDELGERLEADDSTQSHAFLCYVCSGNIDKLVRCWDKSKPIDAKDADAMQDLVEKMMVLLRVVETRTNGYQALGEAASDKLAAYASTLASQGQLNAALEVLPGSSDKHAIQVLRDRLFHSQGDAVAGQQPPPFPFAREGFQLGQRPSAQVQPQRQPARSAYGQKPFYGQPTSNMMPAHQEPQPTYSQPGPGRQHSSNPYASTQPIQRNTYSASVSQTTPSNMFTPQAVTPMSTPNMSTYQPISTMYQPYTPPVSNNARVMQPQAPSVPLPPVPTSDSYGDGVRPQPGGWNDPPPLNPNRVPRRKKQNPKPFAPEDLNIMTPQQPTAVPPGMMPGGHMQPPHFAGPGSMMPPASSVSQVQAPPPGSMLGVVNQPPPNSQPSMMQSMQQPAPSPSVPTAASKDAPKAPIPPEHQVLQKQFDELIGKCQSQTTNAQMKRKLDDCSRRLEFLYDKLRANTLSPNIIGGLHQVAQCIGSRDYASGLKFHTQIVSQSNFSEISAFMPGLKSMIQIASQLRV